MEVDISKVVGMTEREALVLIRLAGLRHRIKRRDKKEFALDNEFWVDRITLEIEDEKVVKARFG